MPKTALEAAGPGQRQDKKVSKTDKIFSTLLLLATIALIVFLQSFNKMDKIRFRAQVMMKKMRENILAWLKAAEGLLERLNDRPEYAEFKSLAGEVRSASGRQWPDTVPKLNRIHILVQAVVEDLGADPDVASSARELNEISDRLTELRADYNKCAKNLGVELGRSIGGRIGKIFRFRPMEQLADFALTLPDDAPPATLPLRFRTLPEETSAAAGAENAALEADKAPSGEQAQ